MSRHCLFLLHTPLFARSLTLPPFFFHALDHDGCCSALATAAAAAACVWRGAADLLPHNEEDWPCLLATGF